MRASKGLLQAYDVQNFAHAAIMSFKRQVTKEDGSVVLGEYGAQVLLQLVKAWETAQDRVRIHRNKPLPGSLKPEPKRKGKTSAATITVLEPISADDEQPAPADTSTAS